MKLLVSAKSGKKEVKMDETQKADEKKAENNVSVQGTPAQNINGGQSLIEQANAAAERMERANAEHKLLMAQEAELFSRKLLGGRSEAGLPVPVQKEETPKEYAKRLYNGQI